MPTPTAAPTESNANPRPQREARPRPWRSAAVVVWLVAHAAVLATLAWAADPPGPAIALDDLAARADEPMGSREGDAWRSVLVAEADDEVRVGAELYDRNCSVCHGDTGLGFAEAKLAFPADHRTCTRCHRPGNPTQMSFEQMMLRQHDLFDVGAPPALRGPDALRAFSDPVALWAYTDATMPRYQPGRLGATEVRAIVGFLWHANGRDARAALAALEAVAPGPTPQAPPPID
jgi:cytochrome c5